MKRNNRNSYKLMRGLWIKYFSAMILIPAMLSFKSSVRKAEHSDAEQFTGRWTLHLVETKKDEASPWIPRSDHYRNRQGYIIYDGKGGMGVHHVTENYQHYRFESDVANPDSLTRNDLRHLANNVVYFGKYRVDDSLVIIEHHIESANLPRMWGAVARRNYRFNGDTLTLQPVTGKYPKTRLHWIRTHD